MCHDSSGWGLDETLGVGKSTVTLSDLEHADLIFSIGQNPGTNHPRMLTSMNRDDIAEAGVQARQRVDLTSHFNGERRTARDFRVIPHDMPLRCTATYYPETNPLVALGSVAEISNTPASKSVVIAVQPSDLPR